MRKLSKKIIDKCKSILFLIAKACENHEIRENYYKVTRISQTAQIFLFQH